MKNKNVLVKLSCIILAVMLLCCSLSGCAESKIMELGEVEIDNYLYEFLLSRMKGTLSGIGYNVDSVDFWNTVFSSNGMTYGEYFKAQVLKQAYSYAVSEFLFQKEGLTLPDESVELIDTLMDKLIERAGSKNNLNAELANYGVNYKILREIYVMEAKMQHLKEYYYGKNAEKIDKKDKDAYYNENYVSFKQILIAGYFYACETEDGNIDGTPVYFVKDNANKIAYDTENGSVKIDEFGKTVTDKYGDAVYYLEDGSVAYDKKNGVLKYILDENGERVPCFYGNEKLGELKSEADEIASLTVDAEGFDMLISEYDQSEGANEVMYLLNSPSYYSSQTASAKYLDDIAAALGKMKVGEMKVVSSDYGYHIIYKYENGDGAYDDEKYKDVFDTFNDDVIEYMFSQKCDEYESKVEINDEVWDNAIGFMDISANTLY